MNPDQQRDHKTAIMRLEGIISKMEEDTETIIKEEILVRERGDAMMAEVVMRLAQQMDEDRRVMLALKGTMKPLIILIALVLCPLKFTWALLHCARPQHHYDLDCENFRFKIVCHDCGKVFLDEMSTPSGPVAPSHP